MFMTAIEATDLRDVAISDTKGAFLLDDQEDFATVKFVNEQVYMMCEIDEKHKKCATFEGK